MIPLINITYKFFILKSYCGGELIIISVGKLSICILIMKKERQTHRSGTVCQKPWCGSGTKEMTN